MSLGLAFRAFFAVLSRRESAERVRAALDTSAAMDRKGLAAPGKLAENTIPSPAPAPPKTVESPPKRSEALTLLSALQREARLIDLIMEPLDEVEDAAVGAAVREVLRDSQKTLMRMFAIEPLAQSDEGQLIDLPAVPSPAAYRLVGASTPATKRGTITHRGWRATKCDVPKWTGAATDSELLAPIEVEVG